MEDAMPMNNDEYVQMFTGFSGKRGDLIPLLQVCQKKYGYISEESVHQIAHYLKISENHIFGVTSFYAQFRFRQPAKNSIRVCLGTACHVQGGQQLSQEIQARLGIHPGEATPDKQYDYEEVACLGCCAQASVVEINGKIYGKMTPDQLDKVLQEHE